MFFFQFNVLRNGIRSWFDLIDRIYNTDMIDACHWCRLNWCTGLLIFEGFECVMWGSWGEFLGITLQLRPMIRLEIFICFLCIIQVRRCHSSCVDKELIPSASRQWANKKGRTQLGFGISLSQTILITSYQRDDHCSWNNAFPPYVHRVLPRKRENKSYESFDGLGVSNSQESSTLNICFWWHVAIEGSAFSESSIVLAAVTQYRYRY